MFDIRRACSAMREGDFDAWLFYNFRHRDPISDRILQVAATTHNTRPWLYLLHQDGSALKLVHGIEERILDHLPGDKRIYFSREQFVQVLRQAAGGMGEVACISSSSLPTLSFLDHGTARLLEECGFHLADGSALLQRFLGLLTPAGIESHCRAADKLYAIVAEVWKRLRHEMRGQAPLWESTVQGWIVGLFQEMALTTDSAPTVACGKHSTDGHYDPREHGGGRGSLLEPGGVVLLDLWAKEQEPASIYADITWMGVLASSPAPEVERAFRAVTGARDRALQFIAAGLESGCGLSGREVDVEVRRVLTEAGYADCLRHRTGHGIDEETHGFGVNLDSIEFPDSRPLLEGSCFSIEPGVYLADFGVRSEINVYIQGGRPVVSGGRPQVELLVF